MNDVLENLGSLAAFCIKQISTLDYVFDRIAERKRYIGPLPHIYLVQFCLRIHAASYFWLACVNEQLLSQFCVRLQFALID